MWGPSKYLLKMIYQIGIFGDGKPTESISDARWMAMVKHIKREYLKEK